MNEQKAVTRETREEYHKAGKKEKGLILDQYVRLTGYNRKYAVRLLSKPVAGKTVMTVIDGKTVVYKAEKKPSPENRLGKPIYTRETLACIEAMWRFYWYKCGNYLAEFIRQNIDFLTASRRPDFHITPDIRAQLLTISGRQIDRLLKPALRLRCISGTKSAANALSRYVSSTPIRSVLPPDFARPIQADFSPASLRQFRFRGICGTSFRPHL